MERYKKLILLFSVLAVGIITISVIFALKSDEKTKKDTYQKESGKSGQQTGSPEVKGTLMMLTGIDLDSSMISAVELETGVEHSLTFTGGTDIRTRNLRTISATYLSKGNIAVIDFDENERINSLVGSDKVWSYKNVSRIKIDDGSGRIEIGSSVYRLGKNYKVLNDDAFVSLESLVMNGMDMIDLYGIENNVYLIKIVSGHGYLTLTNYEDFIEGNLYYGMGKCVEVTDNLRLMLPEGEQEITVQKDGQTANAIVKIMKDSETSFDLEGYGPEPIDYKTVTFNISPQGSLLYIDGIKTSYQEPVSLTAGFHQIEAELGGYTGYKGSIEVESDGMVKNISLSPVPTEIPDDVIYDSFTETDDEGEDSSGNDYSNTPAPDDADLNGTSWDIPDNTSVGNEDGNLEVLDGDDAGNSQSSGNGSKNTNSSNNISIVGDNDDEEEEKRDTKRYSGEMTIYCSEGTEIYIDDVYKGRVSGGSLTTPKPVGTIELKLVKSGYVTKKYTLTMDEEEESSIFKFPDMTPEGR